MQWTGAYAEFDLKDHARFAPQGTYQGVRIGTDQSLALEYHAPCIDYRTIRKRERELELEWPPRSDNVEQRDGDHLLPGVQYARVDADVSQVSVRLAPYAFQTTILLCQLVALMGFVRPEPGWYYFRYIFLLHYCFLLLVIALPVVLHGAGPQQYLIHVRPSL
jgi:hypothetical protein